MENEQQELQNSENGTRNDDSQAPEAEQVGSTDARLEIPLVEKPELGAPSDENSEAEEKAENSNDASIDVDKESDLPPSAEPDTESEETPSPNEKGDVGSRNDEPIDSSMQQLDLQGAIDYVAQETKKLQDRVNELEQKEEIRLGSDFKTFMLWSRKREKVEPLDDSFYAFEDAWNKALAMIEPLKPYIENRIYKDVLFSVGLHYIICEPYFYDAEDEHGDVVELENPLYKKHSIASKAYIVSSASDEGSSSSIHTTKSLNDGDFVMQDLLRTRYGTWVYSILEQLDIGAVLL